MKSPGSWNVGRASWGRPRRSHHPQPTIHGRSGEAGFAMLLVFAMAAAVGILLYTELPRVAFEAQRAREQLLIDRGEQYQRAIQLYFRKTRQFPANLDQLENTNRFRFLRHRYRDPITGKDEWRLIHIGPGGMLTDSLTQKPPGLKKDEKEEKAEATGEAKPGSELPSAATRRRASEMGGPGLPGSVPPGGVAQPGAQSPGQEGQTAQYALYPPAATGQPYPAPQYGIYPQPQPDQPYPRQTFPPEPNPEPQVGQTYIVPGQIPSQPGGYPTYPPGQAVPMPVPSIQPGQVYPVIQPGQPYPYTQQPTAPPGAVRIFPGAPGQAPPGFIQGLLTPGGPGVYSPGTPPQGLPSSSQTGGVSPAPYQYPQPGPQPSSSPYSQMAQPPTGSGPSNPALEMIRKILTTPRPGGLGQAQGQQPFTYGAGIAGVASKAEADSIMVYNERTRYNEWEFIYDLRKDRTMVGPMGPGGAPAGTLLQPPAGPGTGASPSLPTSPSPGAGGRGR